MKNITKQGIKIASDLPGQKQSADLRFCRAWWEYKKALYPKLGNAALRVFLVLEDRASRWNNYTVPMSLATLGEETGVKHHTTLAAGIRELEAAKIIAVTRHAGNSRQANIYALLIHELIGDEQQVFGNSSTNNLDKCECEGACQFAASAKAGKSQSSDNCAQFTGDVNYTSNRKISKAASNNKVTANATIPSNQSSHAISAAVSASTTSAENELLPVLESPTANFGSAKTDSVLSCTNTTNNKTNKINWFNPDGLNGVTAAKIQPVKAKLGQSQRHDEHGGQTGSSATIAAAKPVQFQVQAGVSDTFEPKTYSYQLQSQPKEQNQNTRQLQEEYFKRLSWATNARERMAVLFSALRMVLQNELEKAEFSGIQALVNEYGCKAVLAGILATLNRAADRQAYFVYLRGVIRRQGTAALVTGNSYSAFIPAPVNSPRGYRRQLPIDLAKYTGSGKYAHIVGS